MSDLFAAGAAEEAIAAVQRLADLPSSSRIDAINEIRRAIHTMSPLSSEPVDFVQWIHADLVGANDYNPNSVAPPEMKLLETSIVSDGYTQPIVAWMVDGGRYEVVDGFHRSRVGRESAVVAKRTGGYLPLVVINSDRMDRGDRIAATIRHNRARGKHRVDSMSEIVVELKRRNWSDDRIGNELGMDPDEVLRLCQISGLAEMFSDREFSEAWEHSGEEEASRAEGDDQPSGDVDLDWMGSLVRPVKPPGWHDRTESSAVLYGENGSHLAMIQRSRFRDEWFVYVYTTPPTELRSPDRDSAKLDCERVLIR